MTDTPRFRFGRVALLGKPNVGKSTLVNALVGERVSIVSNKPQTTRRTVVGVVHGPDYQIALIDTPGIHQPSHLLGRFMLEQARSSVTDCDLIMIVMDGSHHPGADDQRLAEFALGIGDGSGEGEPKSAPKLLLCINKMDLLKADRVERNVGAATELFRCEDYMLTCATKKQNIAKLLKMIVERLPNGEPEYSSEDFTDQSERSLAAELIREQILARTRSEIPYSVAVRIEKWEAKPGIVDILATLLVERASQRSILIGQGGAMLKEIGTASRIGIERLIDSHVFLDLHVKAETEWRANPRVLHELDYG